MKIISQKPSRLYRGILKFVLLLMLFSTNCKAKNATDLNLKEAIGFDADFSMENDTIPVGKIRLKPEYNNGLRVFEFTDKNGKKFEKNARELPVLSKYARLDFPKVIENANGIPLGWGVADYSLIGISFNKRKEIFKKAGIDGVPDSIIETVNKIQHVLGPVKLVEGGNHILYSSNARFYGIEKSTKYDYLWDQGEIIIFDHTCNVIQELSINKSMAEAEISADGKYLLMCFITPAEYDAPQFNEPIYVYNFKTAQTDTINVLDKSISLEPWYMLYGDSFFQLILGNGSQMLHLLINPDEKIYYSRQYDAKAIADPEIPGGFVFKSMQLPNKTKVNLEHYTKNQY